MKKFVLFVFAALMAVAPLAAQGRKVVKRAKEDAKMGVQALKKEGYKALDNMKLEEAVKKFLTSKYSDKSCVEVAGRATGVDDLNEGRAQARMSAVGGYPDEDILETFFVYKKDRRKFDVTCFALVSGSSARMAGSTNAAQVANAVGTAAAIASEKDYRLQKEARKKEVRMKKEANKKARKAERKAEKKVQQARKKAEMKVQQAEKEAAKKLQQIQD